MTSKTQNCRDKFIIHKKRKKIEILYMCPLFNLYKTVFTKTVSCLIIILNVQIYAFFGVLCRCIQGTPTKRQVSKRQVSKRPVQNVWNVRFTKRQVYKTSGYIFVSYFNVVRLLCCESLHIWKFFSCPSTRIRVNIPNY